MINLQNLSSNKTQSSFNLSEEEQFDEICILLKEDVVAALKLANSTLRNKKYFRDLLEKGLESADASRIELWLKYLVPRLGFRSVINILDKRLISRPDQVEKALYWLPKFLKKDNSNELELFKNLKRKTLENKELDVGKMLGNEYKDTTQSGQTYKLILKIITTNEYAIFGGYQLGNKEERVIVEILDSAFYRTGDVKLVSPRDLEILDPQPYDG